MLAYSAPAISCSETNMTEITSAHSFAQVSGDGWKGYIIKGISPSSLKLTADSAVATNATFSLGVDPMIDAFYTDGVLNYVGTTESVFCLCALNADGVLYAGRSDIYTAVNSDFLWAVEAKRVLVSNGAPMTDLGGGYGCRAAIGQAADGSIIMIFAEGNGLYPSGITYDELAALMYEAGALTAVAIDTDGSFIYGDNRLAGKASRNGLVMWAFSEGGTVNE